MTFFLTSQSRKKALVTGASSGIGEAVAHSARCAVINYHSKPEVAQRM